MFLILTSVCLSTVKSHHLRYFCCTISWNKCSFQVFKQKKVRKLLQNWVVTSKNLIHFGMLFLIKVPSNRKLRLFSFPYSINTAIFREKIRIVIFYLTGTLSKKSKQANVSNHQITNKQNKTLQYLTAKSYWGKGKESFFFKYCQNIPVFWEGYEMTCIQRLTVSRQNVL